MTDMILQADNVTKAYGEEHVVKGISLNIHKDSFTVILGQSGSGKSTLLNILSGQIRPTGGRVLYNNQDITGFSEGQLADWKRTEISNVFQNYLLLGNLTAEENIKIGAAPGKEAVALRPYKPAVAAGLRREPLDFSRLVDILEIGAILQKFPAQLSGGQQQRVAIARAVIKAPSILFCDEATGALDETNSKKVVELLHILKSIFGITILFTSHNKQIAETADRVITIKDGLLHRDAANEKPISAGDMVWG